MWLQLVYRCLPSLSAPRPIGRVLTSFSRVVHHAGSSFTRDSRTRAFNSYFPARPSTTSKSGDCRKREWRTDLAVKRAFYRLADEKREIILVACSKCDWRAAFARDELIAAHGADYAMPNLLNHLAAPGCSRLGSQWDRCGVHVEPIEGAR
jgi:hypothetical protein